MVNFEEVESCIPYKNPPKTVSFYRPWNDYKNGFTIEGDNYWLGLERIYQLTRNKIYKLRVELLTSYSNDWLFAEYNSFYIDSEAANYTLHLADYVIGGTTGDILLYSYSGDYRGAINNRPFSTYDRNNINNVCALFRGVVGGMDCVDGSI